jgi:hypothetical protein
MCLSKPVPLTGNISAGKDSSNPYFRSPKGTFSKALEMFFLHIFVEPSSVKHACFNSSDVMREHIGMGLERSSKRHLQSQKMNLGSPPFMCPIRLFCPEVSPAMKCIHRFTQTRCPITSVQKPPTS